MIERSMNVGSTCRMKRQALHPYRSRPHLENYSKSYNLGVNIDSRVFSENSDNRYQEH